MKTALLLSLVAGASAFAVLPQNARANTALNAALPESEMTADQKKIADISAKWKQVRLMSKEESASLDAEWKEAYDRYFEKYDKDVQNMKDIAAKVQRMIEPKKVEKKTKGQKKRDAYAKVLAREAARAAKK